MIEGVTIAQLAGDAQGICNAGFGDVLLGATLFISAMAIPQWVSYHAMKSPLFRGRMGGGGFDETPSTIETLQNAYARGQIDMDKFELLVAGAICKEKGYDEELTRRLLKQEIDDSDTEGDE